MALGDRVNIALPDFASGLMQRASDLLPTFAQRGGGIAAPNLGGQGVGAPGFGGGQVQSPGFQQQYGPPPMLGQQNVPAPNFTPGGGNFSFGGSGVQAPNFAVPRAQWPSPHVESTTGATGPNVANGSATGNSWGGAATADDNQGVSADQINAYIARVQPSAPLNGMGKFILDTANKHGVSVMVMLGIMQKESGFGSNVGVGNLTGIKNGESFVNTGNWQQSIEATAANLDTDLYRGKSVAEQIGYWFVGPQKYASEGLNATDSTGGKNGTVGDYVNLVMGVYNALGKSVSSTQGGTLKSGASNVIAAGEKLLGTPYLLGGLRTHPNDPRQGIDCSEFTAYAFQQLGVRLPWNAQAQFNQTQRVDKSQLQVGDLVFFTNTYDAGEVVTHVGIYAGMQNGHPVMLNSSNDGVSYQQLDSSYWSAHYYGAGRVAKQA